MYKRKEYATLLERINEPRAFIQVLMGPRQVGKSTLMGQVLEATSIPHLLFSADTVDENDSDWIARSWESARVTMSMHKHKEFLLVIDEIQKIRNWRLASRNQSQGRPFGFFPSYAAQGSD